MLKDSKNKEKLGIDENIKKAERNEREREKENVSMVLGNLTKNIQYNFTVSFIHCYKNYFLLKFIFLSYL